MNATQVQIRVMTENDIPLGIRLKSQAGWNQSEASWRRFLAISPEGCFVAEDDGVGLATVAVFEFGPVAWIAMVLVDESCRGCGLGTRMMTHALDWCERRGIHTVRLDATPLGQPVYTKLGFVSEYPLARFERPGGARHHPASDSFIIPESPDPIIELDRATVGYDRSPMLNALWDQNPQSFRLFPGRGFAALYHGSGATHIGPVIANDGEAGVSLLDDALGRCEAQRVFIDLALDNNAAVAWAARLGFTHQRGLTRMRRGQPIVDHPGCFFATSGPEKG